MENVKQPNSVSVNSALHTRGFSENSSFWDDFCNILDCLSDFETSSCATSIMDFDYE